MQMKSLTTSETNSGDKDLDLKLLNKETKRPGADVRQGQRTGPRQQHQCGNCGGRHTSQQRCPAIGIECYKCGRRNHFARVCRTKVPRGRPKLRELEYDSSSENDMVVDTLSSETHKKDWHTTIKVNEHGVKFKIDTGAQCNVLSLETYRQVSQQPLKKSQAKLVAFGGQRIRSYGKAIILCEHKSKYYPIEFEVISNVSNVLGLQTITELKLVKPVDTITNDPLAKYADTFTGLGCITNVTHHIKVDHTSKPVVHPPCKIPVTIRARVKEELQRMERLGVIEKIHEPTDWVNSMVTVVKPNGKL